MLAIRSKDRQGTSSSDFRIKVQQPISGTYILSHAHIPNTIYNVRDDNNSIVVQVGQYAPVTLHVPPGFYGVNELLQALQTQLHTADATVSCSYDDRTARITIARPSGLALDFTAATSIAPLLGFEAEMFAYAVSHTASSVLDLTSKHMSFNIVVQAHGVSYSTTDTEGRQSSFIIPNTENSMGLVNYNVKTSYDQCIHFRSAVREMHIQLLDADFTPVDLQGGEWMMVYTKIR